MRVIHPPVVARSSHLSQAVIIPDADTISCRRSQSNRLLEPLHAATGIGRCAHAKSSLPAKTLYARPRYGSSPRPPLPVWLTPNHRARLRLRRRHPPARRPRARARRTLPSLLPGSSSPKSPNRVMAGMTAGAIHSRPPMHPSRRLLNLRALSASAGSPTSPHIGAMIAASPCNLHFARKCLAARARLLIRGRSETRSCPRALSGRPPRVALPRCRRCQGCLASRRRCDPLCSPVASRSHGLLRRTLA